jgi:hypothetical protein
MTTHTTIEGYDFGLDSIPRSPVSMEALELLKQAVMLTDDDLSNLRLAGDVLADQTDKLVGAWRAVIAAAPHLACYYASHDGVPDETYKARVRERFRQWVLDVCRRPYDQAWLDYQHEIGRRHTHLSKNLADDARALPHIPLRYVLAFTAVVNDTTKPFLAAKGATVAEVEAMHRAWCKAVLLHVTLWSRAYVAESDW